jgi:hypothetical protein
MAPHLTVHGRVAVLHGGEQAVGARGVAAADGGVQQRIERV